MKRQNSLIGVQLILSQKGLTEALIKRGFNIFNQTFYFDLIRKYVILVGSLFSEIRITKTDTDHNITELIKVPITYAPKDKMLARVIQDPSISRPTATMTLPIISFEMGQITYDGPRKLNTIAKIAFKNDANNFKYQYNPVAWNINFKVYVYAKNTEDGTKILEQILPYFTPDWTTKVKLIPETEQIYNIPVVLNSVEYEDTYTSDFEDRRAIIWTLDLTVKGYFFGPIKTSPIIKFANTNFWVQGHSEADLIATSTIGATISVSPGMDANNNPTSNAAASIPVGQIEYGDDFGFVITKTDIG